MNVQTGVLSNMTATETTLLKIMHR